MVFRQTLVSIGLDKRLGRDWVNSFYPIQLKNLEENLMNKTKIRNFAEWAREKLIADITYKAGTLGINENGIAEKLPQSTGDLEFYDIGTKDYAQVSGDEIKQRNALVKAIQSKEKSYSTYKEAFENLVEEVAYTWFNRLIAIRFMEVNDYLPSGIRVLSSENKAKNEPDFVTTPFDADLDLSAYEQDKVLELKDQNKSDELFRMLFIKQCNQLHELLPDLFENTKDYTELLLTISFTDTDGIVYKLVHDIDEDDFNVEKEGGQVEIIGWLYQYYISKKHDEIINIYKGTIKKSDIPAATQLFTTDWVVRYMVDNSLGRYWIERNPNSKLAEKLEFFVTPKDGKINYVDEKVYPTDLTFFDPCMGSGHILVYAFDVLMEIYRECGYSDRDAALNIVQNNLYGMDIDKRAYQLAYFAVMMKVRSYNRRALTQGIFNNLAVAEESNAINKFTCEGLTKDSDQNKIGKYLVQAYKDAQEIGTLQTIEEHDYKRFAEYLLNLGNDESQIDLFASSWLGNVKPLMLKLAKQAAIMSKKYTVVCTNPPYMNKFEGHLKKFIVDNFNDYKGDMFSVFMYRNFGYCIKNGYSAFMTPFVWMFIKTYEKLREYIINNKALTTLVQMEYSAFEEATVPICSFVLQNCKSENKSLCFRLSDFKGGMEVQKNKVLEALDNKECGYFFESNTNEFKKIPNEPIAYFVSETMFKIFEHSQSVATYGNTREGMATGSNDLFMRYWFEVEIGKMKTNCGTRDEAMESSCKWFPYNKGGDYRKWYGNDEYVVNWYKDGFEIMNFKDEKTGRVRSHNYNLDYIFRQGISWTALSSGNFGCRYSSQGKLADSKGSMLYLKNDDLIMYFLGLLNSCVSKYVLGVTSQTLDFKPGRVAELPVVVATRENVEKIVNQQVEFSKMDWDSFETSWDFEEHPLVKWSKSLWDCTAIGATMSHYYGEKRPEKVSGSLELCHLLWQGECNERFNQLKANEEELNRIFIDIYGLQDELTPEVEDKDVTVRKADLQRDIKSLISYAVGCMLGRYSLDCGGFAFAGGDWDETKYKSFVPDQDNCIPITDEEYFEDDIVGRFVEFMRIAFGEDDLEANLNFVANALGNKGNTSREVIRNYFLNDFMKDHIKTYQKRPIYWLFDSGKQNGFKALCYMHRWNADTTGNMRVEYLHRMQRVYDKEMDRMQEIIDNSKDNKEVNTATKRKEKLQKQLKETKDYDAMIAHLALSRIDIDLDDGVKVNYDKVQTVDGKKMQVLAKI